MAVWKATGKRSLTMPVRLKTLRPLEKTEMTARIITVRSERGYSATNYDASAANLQKSLRCQIGLFYDVKKVRNN